MQPQIVQHYCQLFPLQNLRFPVGKPVLQMLQEEKEPGIIKQD